MPLSIRFLPIALSLLAVSPAQAAGPVCDATWHDGARNRDIPVRIRMPEGTGRIPVILFSHGLGGSVAAGTAWATAWADAGFAVIHLQHPGSDQGILAASAGRGRLNRRRDGAGRDGTLGVARGAMNAEQAAARGGDVRFVLDRLAARPGRQGACDLARIDPARVGMAGHSFGAQTTQMLAGQRAAAAEPRLTSFIAFSPSPPAGGASAEASVAMRRPFFAITGTRDTAPMAGRVSPEDREGVFRALPAGGKYLLVLDGADHADLSGGGGRRAGARDPHVTRSVIASTTAFWRWTLLNDEAAHRMLDDANGFAATLNRGDRFERK